MSDDVILGVHSNVRKGQIDPETGKPYGFDAGHAWISVTRDGKTTNYGLWPDEHPRVEDNGSGSDIRTGMEDGDTPAASRYYRLTPEQASKLDGLLKANETWGYMHPPPRRKRPDQPREPHHPTTRQKQQLARRPRRSVGHVPPVAAGQRPAREAAGRAARAALGPRHGQHRRSCRTAGTERRPDRHHAPQGRWRRDPLRPGRWLRAQGRCGGRAHRRQHAGARIRSRAGSGRCPGSVSAGHRQPGRAPRRRASDAAGLT